LVEDARDSDSGTLFSSLLPTALITALFRHSLAGATCSLRRYELYKYCLVEVVVMLKTCRLRLGFE